MVSKEASCIIYINNVFKNFVTGKLHYRMCKKNKLRVYRELNENFKWKKYLLLYGVQRQHTFHLEKSHVTIYPLSREGN